MSEYYHVDRIQEIADHCVTDAIDTYRLWLRHELFKGELDEDAFELPELAFSYEGNESAKQLSIYRHDLSKGRSETSEPTKLSFAEWRSKMSNNKPQTIMAIPKIDFSFWLEKNPIFSHEPLLTNMKTGLNHAKRGGLIDDVIAKMNSMYNDDLVSEIKSEIDKNSNLSGSDEDLLRIFDLIQGWGGRSCRGPYVKPKNSPYRIEFVSFIAHQYRSGLENLNAGDIDRALTDLLKIKYVGESFATKHLYFWGRHGSLAKELPIYDVRIKNLIYGRSSSVATYSQYIIDLRNVARAVNLQVEELERALFAFSMNWFLNDKLSLKGSPVHEIDRPEAVRISSTN